MEAKSSFILLVLKFFFFFQDLFIYDREREAETQAEGEAGSMRREPDVGFDPGSPGSRPGPKAGAKPLHHPGIPQLTIFKKCLFFGPFESLVFRELLFSLLCTIAVK